MRRSRLLALVDQWIRICLHGSVLRIFSAAVVKRLGHMNIFWRWADCTSAVHDATRYHFLSARCKHLLLGICVIHSIAHRLDTPTFLNARDWRAISHIFDLWTIASVVMTVRHNNCSSASFMISCTSFSSRGLHCRVSSGGTRTKGQRVRKTLAASSVWQLSRLDQKNVPHDFRWGPLWGSRNRLHVFGDER